MAEQEIIYNDLIVEENQEVVTVEEIMPAIEVTEVESFEIEMQEAFPALQTDTNYNHALLNNREIRDAHPITAITGLREELDSIEALKTVYSDKKGSADYYEWADRNELAQSRIGYFVTLNRDINTISVCTGDDIFGVVVDRAAFVGGQADAIRDSRYGLVATSGVVLVRCGLDVAEGDYVISNAYGVAKKSTSNCGYRVEALHDIGGVPHATIRLNISADQINLMGAKLQNLDDRVDANYKNIIAAVNTANQAYNKANDIETSNQNITNIINDATEKVEGVTAEVKDISDQVARATLISSQARAIAESADNSASSMKSEAVTSANNAASQVKKLTKNLEPLIEWTDPETGNSGASYLVDYIDNGLATKAAIESVTRNLQHATSAIQQNAKSLQSLVVAIDKYSVGERSAAYDLTLDQATSILEPGIIYVPTIKHKEEYSYVDGETTLKYEREFVPGYLYQWGLLPSGRYGWRSIDKFYKEIANVNISAPSVNFSAQEISIAENNHYGYWYTNADIIYDIDGNISDDYECYTLYKWVESGWMAVATLVGNTQSRVISHMVQTANSIETNVTNIKGDVANSKQWIEDNSVNIQDVVSWKTNNAQSIATTIEKASDSEAYIAQVASIKNPDGTINAAASIVAAVNNADSSVGINADHIVMTGTTIFLRPDDLGSDGSTVISGDRITTGQIDAEKVKVINLQASSIVVTGADDNEQTVDEVLSNTLVSSTIYYALSSSRKTPPSDDDWSEIAPNKERKKYMWQKTVNVYGDGSVEESKVCIAGADGESPIILDIKSSAGTIYINNDITTILLATAYQDNQDITDDFPDEAFLWEKYDMYGNKDTVWSYTGKTITINNLDIYKRAMFNCVLDIEQRIEKEDIE